MSSSRDWSEGVVHARVRNAGNKDAAKNDLDVVRDVDKMEWRREGKALNAAAAMAVEVNEDNFRLRQYLFSPLTMFRVTRPLANALKRTTGITGLAVHPNPLPQLTKTYEQTLSVLASIPQSSVYRQGVEALVLRKLNIVQNANGDIAAAEVRLDEGQIEEALDIASDELSLAAKMVEWKAWEPLEEKPEAGQWEYAATAPSS
ncbi:hypothetical protein DXG01_000184 [Tephrocybe rancida]|nr:hypothetical protein DXG01_000184 [Tephrocybe rancida]